MKLVRRSIVPLFVLFLGIAAVSWTGAGEAQAQAPYYYGPTYYTPSYGGGYPYVAPVYHAPSVHTDYRYHVDRYHWTPSRGVHAHGHYDAVPHYTPGHFDTLHNGHVHGSPWYHH